MTNNLKTSNNTQQINHPQRKSGEALILLHGALADERMWEPHIEILTKDFNTISITQRHFGTSGESSAEGFGINTHADDLINFLTKLDSGPTHLAAWSYGADVALNAAIKSPELIKSLFIYEPGYPGCLNDQEMNEYMQDAEAMFGKVFQAVSEGELKEAAEFLIDRSGNAAGYFSAQSLAHRTQQLENAHTLPLQLSQTEQPTLDKTSLSGIQVPTTIAYGSDTRSLFKIVSRSVSAYIPNSNLIEISSANHMLPLENPEQFSHLIKEHISNLEHLLSCTKN
ncbi:alpha/beta fold hydrolase [Microbulbifer epialgicus]|uniref:Alpha/beta fold hydrolase n=1 Tax=Microbulbifer epialgicus TaxID=393907 RepID=A0ABV4NX52_9GAMM